MPQMANVTIKAANGSTDVVYVAKVPSAGDKTPARWSVDAANTVPAYRPQLEMVTRSNGPRNARIVEINLSYPVTGVVNGNEVKLGSVPVKVYATVPTNLPDTATKEPLYQIGNLLSSALIRASLETGYAPT